MAKSGEDLCPKLFLSVNLAGGRLPDEYSKDEEEEGPMSLAGAERDCRSLIDKGRPDLKHSGTAEDCQV